MCCYFLVRCFCTSIPKMTKKALATCKVWWDNICCCSNFKVKRWKTGQMKSWIQYFYKYFSISSAYRGSACAQVLCRPPVDTATKLLFWETGSGTQPWVGSTSYLKRFFPCQLLRGRGRLLLQTNKHSGLRLRQRRDCKTENPIKSPHEIKIDHVCFLIHVHELNMNNSPLHIVKKNK